MHLRNARFSFACLFSAALALSACSSSATDTTPTESTASVSGDSTAAVSDGPESVPASSPAPVESTVAADAPVTTVGASKLTLVSLTLGDRACYVEMTFASGGASLLGDFELCEGGSKDATALIGKEVRYASAKREIQAASCEGSDSCSETEEVDLVISLTDAAFVKTTPLQ